MYFKSYSYLYVVEKGSGLYHIFSTSNCLNHNFKSSFISINEPFYYFIREGDFYSISSAGSFFNELDAIDFCQTADVTFCYRYDENGCTIIFDNYDYSDYKEQKYAYM